MSKEHKSHLIKIICGILGFFFLLFIWWLVSYLLHQNDNRLLPYPHEVFQKLGEILFAPSYAQTTWEAMGWSLLRLVIGFVISFLFGGVFGTLGGLYPKFASFMGPYISFSKTMPTAAFVLILVGIFYSYRGLAPYIPCFLVFMVAFPVIYEAFKSGIFKKWRSQSRKARDTSRCLGSSTGGGAKLGGESVDVLIARCPKTNIGFIASSKFLWLIDEVIHHEAKILTKRLPTLPKGRLGGVNPNEFLFTPGMNEVLAVLHCLAVLISSWAIDITLYSF